MSLLGKLLPRRTDRQLRGQQAEVDALAYLQRKGLTLVERNFSCKGGEIDLVMKDGQGLVFVEVRQRSSAAYGGAAASVDSRKQQRVVRAAQVYLQRFTMPPVCRIDVVAIDGGELSWIKDAVQS